MLSEGSGVGTIVSLLRAVLPRVVCNWYSGGRSVVELWDEMEEGDEEKDDE